MPYTLNGIGTKFYGHRDEASDGSYVTTEWFTFVYIPLIPMRSFRVLPVGQGTNYIIHRSQNYRMTRVPLCWPQIRNVYLILIPIVLLIFYFNWAEIRDWAKDVGRPDTSAAQTEPPRPAEQPLSDKDAALACGKTLKLDAESFFKLEVVKKMTAVVDDAGFTEEELKQMSSHEDLEKDAYTAYYLAYLTWAKPKDVSRSSLDKMIVGAIHAQDLSKMSSEERVEVDSYSKKMKGMMLNSFHLGRQDARISPCRL